MEIVISSNTSKPIYEQITSQIKALIMSGELQTGDPIPSMRAMAKSLHVSVITVQKAYEERQWGVEVLFLPAIVTLFKKNSSARRKVTYKKPQKLAGQAVFL